MELNIKTLIVIFSILLILLITLSILIPKKKNRITAESLHQCSTTTCTIGCAGGEIANVSDPVYNMKEITKQSLLLFFLRQKTNFTYKEISKIVFSDQKSNSSLHSKFTHIKNNFNTVDFFSKIIEDIENKI